MAWFWRDRQGKARFAVRAQMGIPGIGLATWSRMTRPVHHRFPDVAAGQNVITIPRTGAGRSAHFNVSHELVPHASDRGDQAWLAGIGLDLAAQLTHQHVDAAVEGRPLSVRDVVE